MQFASPRFAGDPVLEEILNDPNTGTKKLQPGSPVESVKLVQRALWDLWWPTKVDPPITAQADEFADGIYGSGTTNTALQYKKQYDIHFPPDAPTGFFDGFAGPRTLAFLDRHCVLFDELDAQIEAKAAEIAASLILRTIPVLGTMGAMRPATGGPGTFFLYAKRGLGVFAAHGAIGDAYLQRHGGPSGPFGWPVGDALDEGPGMRRQEFEFGSLRSVPPFDLVEVVGAEPPTKIQF